MDGLSEAASVIAVVEISGKIASLCFQYPVKKVVRNLEEYGNTISRVTCASPKVRMRR
jgi:hypothetical protein